MKISLRYFNKALGRRRQFFGPMQLIILFGKNKNFLKGGRCLIFYPIIWSVIESKSCDFGWKTFSAVTGMWATVDTYEIKHDCSAITNINYFKNTCNFVESFLDYAQMAIKMHIEYIELRYITTKLWAQDILWSIFESIQNLFFCSLLNTSF